MLLEVQFWFPVWLIFLLDKGFSISQAVIADGVFRLVVVACELPVGVLADRVGRRRSFLALGVGQVVVFISITQVQGMATLFVAWVLWGVVWALSSGAGHAYLFELVRDEREITPIGAFALVRAGSGVAVVVSLVSAGHLYEVDPRLPFLVTALLAVVAIVLTGTLPDVKSANRVYTIRSALKEVFAVVQKPSVRSVVGVAALVVIIGWSPRILFQPLALEVGLSSAATGWMYAGFAAAGVVGAFLAGALKPRQRIVCLRLSISAMVITLAITSWVPVMAPFALLPVMGCAYALATTITDVATSEASTRAFRATTYGMVSMVAGIVIAGARPALGVITDLTTASTAFAWASLGALVLLVPLWLLTARMGESQVQ